MPKAKTHEEFLRDFYNRSPFSNSIKIEGRYETAKSPIMVKCLSCGYRWNVRPTNLLSGTGCPKCAGNIKKTHGDFVAEFKSVNVFSDQIEFESEYQGAFQPITARCKKCGNVWYPLPTNLLKGNRGCPVCSGSGKGTGEHGRKTHEEFLASLRDCSAKSSEIEVIGTYEKSNTPISVLCKKCGFQWKATPSSLLAGSGCPRCIGKGSGEHGIRTHEEFVSDFVEKNPYSDSIVFESEYVSASSSISCYCLKCGFRWKPSATSLLSGKGCPNCAITRRAASKTKTHSQFLEDFKKRNPYSDTIVFESEYQGDALPIKARCLVCGHRWQPRVTHLLSHPTGCPSCAKSSTSFMEQFLFRAFQLLVGEDKTKHRDTEAIGMEIDVFVPLFNFGIEPGAWRFHKNSIGRDAEKRNMGVRIFTIYDSMPNDADCPFDEDCYCFSFDLGLEPGHGTLKTIVSDICRQMGINNNLCSDDWISIEEYAYSHSIKRTHEEFIRVLRERNSKYSSGAFEVIGRYQSDRERVQCKCNRCGHTWLPQASNLLSGQGCPKCSGTMKLTHDEFLDKLQRQNPYTDEIQVVGKYINNESPVDCICKVCGCKWSPSAHDLLGSTSSKGHGCPECAKRRRALSKTKTHEQFLEDFSNKNSHSKDILIVGTYQKGNIPIEVRCKKCGHVWHPTPAQLLNVGSGCPLCAREIRASKLKKTHEEFQDQLNRIWGLGRIILLGKYEGDAKRILCKCGECGHEWNPFAGNLLQKQGCPACEKKRRSDKRKRNVECVETGEIFLGLNDAAKHYGLKTGSSISAAILKGGKAAGRHWRYCERETGFLSTD
jgi:Zn finger protein HypA/HybF involved in hydrogenase expression